MNIEHWDGIPGGQGKAGKTMYAKCTIRRKWWKVDPVLICRFPTCCVDAGIDRHGSGYHYHSLKYLLLVPAGEMKYFNMIRHYFLISVNV
jgi:hypothetical protein